MPTRDEILARRWQHQLPTARNWKWFDQALEKMLSSAELDSNPDYANQIATLSRHVLQHPEHDLMGCWIRSVGAVNAPLPELEAPLYSGVKKPMTELLSWVQDWARSPGDAGREFLPLARNGTLSQAAILRYYFKRLPVVALTASEQRVVEVVEEQRNKLKDSNSAKYARRSDLVFDKYRFSGLRLINVLNKNEIDIHSYTWVQYEQDVEEIYSYTARAAAQQAR